MFVSIGHFLVVSCLFCKSSLGTQPFIREFHSHANKTHFHIKGYAPGFALKKRHKTTQKWLIEESFNVEFIWLALTTTYNIIVVLLTDVECV